MKLVFGFICVFLGFGIILIEGMVYVTFNDVWQKLNGYVAHSYYEDLATSLIVPILYIIPIMLIWIGFRIFEGKNIKILGILTSLLISIIGVLVYMFTHP